VKLCCVNGGEEKQEELTARCRGPACLALLLHLNEEVRWVGLVAVV